jgi:hypothetical protein
MCVPILCRVRNIFRGQSTFHVARGWFWLRFGVPFEWESAVGRYLIHARDNSCRSLPWILLRFRGMIAEP